jgi:hypothetical protein
VNRLSSLPMQITLGHTQTTNHIFSFVYSSIQRPQQRKHVLYYRGSKYSNSVGVDKSISVGQPRFNIPM